MLKKFIALMLAVAWLCPAPAFASCIIWMSDTQHYSSAYADTFYAMTDWTAQAAERLDIRFVFHTGDLVSASRSDAQWETARRAMSTLSDAGIPFLAVTGNHDTGYKNSYGRFRDYVGSLTPCDINAEFGETGSRFALFSDEHRDYIFLTVAFGNRGPSAEELAWANDALARFADRTAIILTHSYIKRSGDLTTQGRAIFTGLVKPNPNVALVLCGHCRDTAYRADELDDDGDGLPDRTVPALMANYQDVGRGGDGFLRVLALGEAGIAMYTYSPVKDSYVCFGGPHDTAFVKLG